MNTPIKEETLMTSSDNSVVLTNRRLFYKQGHHTKEILLKDVVEHKVYKRRYRFYLVLVIIFSGLYLLKGIRYTKPNFEWDNAALQDVLFLVVALFSLIFYFSTHRKLLIVSDVVHKIEIPLQDLKGESFKRFYIRLKSEIDQRKKEI